MLRCEDAAMTLIVAGAPIGHAADASPRLTAELAGADIVAAEDTRRLRRLAADLGVQVGGRVVSYFDGNEASRVPGLLAELLEGARVLLITDAGMPGVSDPGYRLVAAAAGAGVAVTVVPGPSAVLAALAVSALPMDRFCFEGFLPRRTGERSRRLASLADETRTMVFFESPRRVGGTLSAMATAFGAGRSAVVCRELTKTHEEVRRGPVGELARWAADGLLGEVTIVVAGVDLTSSADIDDERLRTMVEEIVATGASRKDATSAVARQSGVPRRRVYAAAHGSVAGSVDRNPVGDRPYDGERA
jgi:16S rRNA (cytidine1402-2'-O)-methyltransferase